MRPDTRTSHRLLRCLMGTDPESDARWLGKPENPTNRSDGLSVFRLYRPRDMRGSICSGARTSLSRVQRGLKLIATKK